MVDSWVYPVVGKQVGDELALLNRLLDSADCRLAIECEAFGMTEHEIPFQTKMLPSVKKLYIYMR